MNPTAIQGILNSAFVQITLPLLVPVIWGFIWQNQQIQEIKGELREIRKDLAEHGARLAAIENELRHHGERIARLEERIPPLVHR